ncbi:MAG: hypothetical protein KIT11_09355 [Fimbriimonadaceae bacterium]|nr:hypothetical protein [Fimbriimonadaceae bacterium]QYK55534.1 MAG: hypothetical protein KF733_11025 [Fimbriimonadaceae bacterium]
MFAGLAALSAFGQANLLANGDLDVTYQQEILPGFFLPKPHIWQNVGTQSISGPYEDEMSSEPWAGPAPTPETTNGFDVTNNDPNGLDWGVFFKPFTGNVANGTATGHLFQDVPGTAGTGYMLTGWAGAEANATMRDAVLAIDFLDANRNVIVSNERSILADLFIENGERFNYKKYSVSATAPAGTAFVRARISMLDATASPNGGGQAFVCDDFDLTATGSTATIIPSAFQVLLGRTASGNLASLANDDNNALRVCKFIVPNQVVDPINVEVSGVSTIAAPTEFSLTAKTRMATTGSFRQNLELFNYSTNNWDVTDTRSDAVNTTFATRTLAGTGVLSRYIGPGNAVKMRYRIRQTGPAGVPLWCHETEFVNWTVKG